MDRKETYQKRLAGVYSYMDAHQLDGAMFTSYENRRYYCGFTGSNGCLIITRDNRQALYNTGTAADDRCGSH